MKTNESKTGQRIILGVLFGLMGALATVSLVGGLLGLAMGLTFGHLDW